MLHYDTNIFFDYLRGELEESLEGDVRSHLTTCNDCEVLLEHCQLLKKAIATQPDYSEQFNQQVLRKIRNLEKTSRPSLGELFREYFSPALQYACAMALFFVHFSGMGTRETIKVEIDSILVSGLPDDFIQEMLTPRTDANIKIKSM